MYVRVFITKPKSVFGDTFETAHGWICERSEEKLLTKTKLICFSPATNQSCHKLIMNFLSQMSTSDSLPSSVSLPRNKTDSLENPSQC